MAGASALQAWKWALPALVFVITGLVRRRDGRRRAGRAGLAAISPEKILDYAVD
jgi:hypothetical protein